MRQTIMTTGRKGEANTPFGAIEFTHTARPVHDILDDIHDVGRPLKLAGKHKAMTIPDRCYPRRLSQDVV